MRLSKILIKTLSTFFYIGYLPLIPGTFGTLAGLCLFYLIKDEPLVYMLATCFLIILGFLISGKAERIYNKKDARYIVIDEVSGILLSFMFIPYDIRLVIVGFFLFRIFDALKPYPAGSLERLRGSIGIMSDDIIAGIYTNLVLQVALRVASFRIS